MDDVPEGTGLEFWKHKIMNVNYYANLVKINFQQASYNFFNRKGFLMLTVKYLCCKVIEYTL